MKLDELLEVSAASKILAKGATFSQLATISEFGATYFFKRLFTPKEVFGKDIKVEDVTRGEKLTYKFDNAGYDHYWIDDGDEKFIYKIQVWNHSSGDIHSAYQVHRDYLPGHENMLKRGHFELLALDPSSGADTEVVAELIKDHNLKLTFDGIMVSQLCSTFEEAVINTLENQFNIKRTTFPPREELIIDSSHSEKALYEPKKQALYILAHLEIAHKIKDSSGYKPDNLDNYYAGCRKAGEPSFKVIDTDALKKNTQGDDVIDISRFFADK